MPWSRKNWAMKSPPQLAHESPHNSRDRTRHRSALAARIEELYAWLEQHCPQPIDTRVQADLAAGRLDTAIQRALDDEKTAARSRSNSGCSIAPPSIFSRNTMPSRRK